MLLIVKLGSLTLKGIAIKGMKLLQRPKYFHLNLQITFLKLILTATLISLAKNGLLNSCLSLTTLSELRKNLAISSYLSNKTALQPGPHSIQFTLE